MDRRMILAPLLALGLSATGSTAFAQASAVQADSSTRVARQQIAGGELTRALATLERAILARPSDGEARLLHASVLCRLDDPSGSLVEFEQLRGWDLAPALWDEATKPCEAPRAGGRP